MIEIFYTFFNKYYIKNINDIKRNVLFMCRTSRIFFNGKKIRHCVKCFRKHKHRIISRIWLHSGYRSSKGIVLYITKVARSTVKQLINIAPTIPCSYPSAASKLRLPLPPPSFVQVPTARRERTPITSFLLIFFVQ